MITITVDRAVLEQALEALEPMQNNREDTAIQRAITALRAALAQQEKENIAQNLQSRLDAALLLEERRQEIAQPHRETEQEPVAYTSDVARRMREARMTFHLGMPHATVMEQMTRFHDLVCAEASVKAAAAFATPPRREWRGLTMQEINALPEVGGRMWNMGSAVAVLQAIRAVEAALKEKNNG